MRSRNGIILAILAVLAMLALWAVSDNKVANGQDDAMPQTQTRAMEPETSVPVTHDHIKSEVKNPVLLAQIPSDIVLGNSQAAVTMIEYASLSCSHCAHFHNTVLPDLTKRYVNTGKVKFIFRPFPLNEPALVASMVASCAGPEKYYTLLKALFAAQEQWAFNPGFKESLASIAGVGGIDRARFDACLQDKDKEMEILVSRKQGADELGVDSTPTFFINGKKITGDHSLDAISGLIDPMLAK